MMVLSSLDPPDPPESLNCSCIHLSERQPVGQQPSHMEITQMVTVDILQEIQMMVSSFVVDLLILVLVLKSVSYLQEMVPGQRPLHCHLLE